MDLGLFLVFSLSVIILPSAIDMLTYSLRDADGHLKISAASMLLCVEFFKLCTSWLMQQYYSVFSKGGSNEKGKFSTPTTARCLSASQEEDEESCKTQRENSINYLSDFRSKKFWSIRGKYAAPAMFYGLQNNLCVKAMVYLNPPVFTVFMQGSIIVTCIWEFLILRRRRNLNQLIALAVMVLGLIVLEIHNLVNFCPEGKYLRAINPAEEVRIQKEDSEHRVLGLTYVLIVLLSSSLSGVVVEYLFRNADVTVDMWQKNIWLYGWGVAVNFAMWSWDKIFIAETTIQDTNSTRSNINGSRGSISSGSVGNPTFLDSFFLGWDYMVIIVMILRTIDGVLISIVFAKLGATLKNLGKVVQVVLIAAGTCIFLNVSLKLNYYVGACMAMLGVWLFMLNQKHIHDAATPPEEKETLVSVS